jgi:hypothetical protein
MTLQSSLFPLSLAVTKFSHLVLITQRTFDSMRVQVIVSCNMSEPDDIPASNGGRQIASRSIIRLPHLPQGIVCVAVGMSSDDLLTGARLELFFVAHKEEFAPGFDLGWFEGRAACYNTPSLTVLGLRGTSTTNKRKQYS